MTAIQSYASPFGTLLLTADEIGLTEILLDGEKAAAAPMDAAEEAENSALRLTRQWLDLYFAGERPDFLPPLHPCGTPFRLAVWRLLLEIPYGETTTYGALAQKLAEQLGKACMSAQAVGGAVGRNPIPIVIPCHRVMGADGSLTGFGWGLERKAQLLTLEGIRVPAEEKRRSNAKI